MSGDGEINTLISLARKYMWAGEGVHRTLQQSGVILEPARFYSSVPTLEELDSSFENGSPPPYSVACSLDPERVKAELESLAPFAAEFDPPKSGTVDNPQFFWDNGAYSWLDAVVYYGMIRKHRPKRIIEIGAGFSTLVARQAVAANGCGEITCVEPFPRPWLPTLDDIELVQSPAQSLSPDFFNERLDDGDLLFIDSTHTVKAGSDCCHIYLRLLPNLKRRTLIHVHDIFLPYGLPDKWLRELHIHWTEQYLLQAYLLDNPLVEVLLGTHYASLNLPEMAERLMAGRSPARGQSYWFWRNAASA